MNNLLATLFTTRFQLRFLQWLAFPIHLILRLFTGNTVVMARRQGIQWELDLSEAIDFCLWLGCYELDLHKALLEQIKEGNIVLDIGANRGAHTMVLAKLVGPHGHVHAFEATLWGVKKIERLLELNPALKSRVTIHHLFLLAPGETSPEVVSASWSIGKDIDDPERNVLDQGFSRPLANAGAITLDEWVKKEAISKIDFIKMDVDGNEVSIIRGSTEALKELSPVIFMELSPIHYRGHRHSFADQVSAIKDQGYDLFSLNKSKKLPQDAPALEAQIPPGVLVNVLAVKTGGQHVLL